MAALIGPAGTRGCSLLKGQTFHATAIPTNSAVTWPPGTTIGRVRITKSILRDRDPCALSHLIAETARRDPNITAFHTKANLNQDVLDVFPTVDVWHLGNHIPSVCAWTGDGKAMLSANYHKGKCWVGRHCIDSLARANSVPAQCRWGSFLRAIGPCNHVSDIEHGSFRIADAIVKRVNETLKDLIENGAPNVARAARDAGKAWVLELHKLLDEVKNVPHAERLAPRPEKI